VFGVIYSYDVGVEDEDDAVVDDHDGGGGGGDDDDDDDVNDAARCRTHAPCDLLKRET
jgi:hypothetical protein